MAEAITDVGLVVVKFAAVVMVSPVVDAAADAVDGKFVQIMDSKVPRNGSSNLPLSFAGHSGTRCRLVGGHSAICGRESRFESEPPRRSSKGRIRQTGNLGSNPS